MHFLLALIEDIFRNLFNSFGIFGKLIMGEFRIPFIAVDIIKEKKVYAYA